MTRHPVAKALLVAGLVYLALPVVRIVLLYAARDVFLPSTWRIGLGFLVAAAVYPRAPRPVAAGVAALALLPLSSAARALSFLLPSDAPAIAYLYPLGAVGLALPPLILGAVAWRKAPASGDAGAPGFDVRLLRTLAALACVASSLLVGVVLLMLPWSLTPVPPLVVPLALVGIVAPLALIPTLRRRDTRLGAKLALGAFAAMALMWLLTFQPEYQFIALLNAPLLAAALLAWPVEPTATPASPPLEESPDGSHP